VRVRAHLGDKLGEAAKGNRARAAVLAPAEVLVLVVPHHCPLGQTRHELPVETEVMISQFPVDLEFGAQGAVDVESSDEVIERVELALILPRRKAVVVFKHKCTNVVTFVLRYEPKRAR
jgi:hypothetical protein